MNRMRLVRAKTEEVANSNLGTKIISILRSNGLKVTSHQILPKSIFAPYITINLSVSISEDDSGRRMLPSAVLDSIALLKRVKKNFLYSVGFSPKQPRLLVVQIKEFDTVEHLDKNTETAADYHYTETFAKDKFIDLVENELETHGINFANDTSVAPGKLTFNVYSTNTPQDELVRRLDHAIEKAKNTAHYVKSHHTSKGSNKSAVAEVLFHFESSSTKRNLLKRA